MTDLTEMVEWLRGIVEGDLDKAKEDAEHPQMIASFTGELSDEEAEEIRKRLMPSEPAKLVVLDEPTTVVHGDPRDTIARCEAELEIIDEHEITDQGCETCGNYDLTGLHHHVTDGPCKTIRLLVRARRHRPGYKETWTA
jgi:hypothetical protein